MRLTITIGEEIHNLEVHESMDISSLKALLGADLNIPEEQLTLFYNSKELIDVTKSIEEYGIKEDDLIVANFKSIFNNQQNQLGTSNSSRPQTNEDIQAEALRMKILSIPQLKRKLEETSPEMAAAAETDPVKFYKLFKEFEAKQRQMALEKQREMELLQADPFNVEAQKKIEEIIRTQNIMENMHQAMEFNPASFGTVHMLYINLQVNGHHVKAFVDSGAQSTIISPDCAERCGLMRLLDTRFQGIARGVGTAKILGKIHNAPIKFGNKFFPCSFIVLEGKSIEMLFGLDMLKAHQACIDLKEDVLKIGEERLPFLPEHEIPKVQYEELTSLDQNPSMAPVAQTSSGVTGSILAQPLGSIADRQFSENDIKSLMDIGSISREHAIAILTQCNGNVDLAVDILIGSER